MLFGAARCLGLGVGFEVFDVQQAPLKRQFFWAAHRPDAAFVLRLSFEVLSQHMLNNMSNVRSVPLLGAFGK